MKMRLKKLVKLGMVLMVLGISLAVCSCGSSTVTTEKTSNEKVKIYDVIIIQK